MDRIADLLAGTPYRAVRRLGRGGMGEVYVVEHVAIGREFALKVLHSHFQTAHELEQRMRIEAQAAARLNHPNVVEVVDFWTLRNGRPCFVMELLHGRNLHDEVDERGPLPVFEAVDFACQALLALSAAHKIGVIHRDIKPENLFLHELSGFPRVLKVLDFGVARVLPDISHLAPAPLSRRTQSGAVVGSPLFMSPEAARGERVDHRTDLYSLGLVLYFMLAARLPFDELGRLALPPSQHCPERISTELDQIMLRALSEPAAARYQNADEFHADLRRSFPVRRHSRAPRSF